MPTHAITLDQTSDPLTTRDIGYAAFCACGWRGDWHHADAQASWPNDQAIDEAEQAAADEGDEHLAEHGAEVCGRCGATITTDEQGSWSDGTGGDGCDDGVHGPAEIDAMGPRVFLDLAVPALDPDGYAVSRGTRLAVLADRLAQAPDLTGPGADLMVRLSYTARYSVDPGPLR